MITVHCTCGETYQADDAHVGRAIRCRCGQILEIAAPVADSTSFRRAPAPQHAPEVASSGVPQPLRPSLHTRLALGSTLSIALLLVLWALSRVDTPAPTSAPTPRVPASRSPDSPRAVTPSCPADSVIRPRSSKELGGNHRRGLSLLRIVNGTDFDAVAVLVEAPEGLSRRAIYIRSNESGIITQIPRGAYELRFQLGSSWHTDRRFCQVTATSQFDRPLAFEERKTYDGVEYSNFEVTLHPVPLGTATTHSIPASAFDLPPP